jgi:hypothetical protein
LADVWLRKVSEHWAQHPFDSAELKGLEAVESSEARAYAEANPAVAYGATLLLAAAFGHCVLLAQLGDGDILTLYEDGRTERPLPEDERLLGNQTTSLCQANAAEEFRFAVLSNEASLPVLTLLSTDGYANSFQSERDFLQIGPDYLELAAREGLDNVLSQLPAILEEASARGSGDDITLAILQRNDAQARAANAIPAERSPAPAQTAEKQRSSITSRARQSTPWILLMIATFAAVLAGARYLGVGFHGLGAATGRGTSTLARPDPAWTAMVKNGRRQGTALRLDPTIAVTSDQLGMDTPETDPIMQLVHTPMGLALKNLSPHPWKVLVKDGKAREIGAGATIPLVLRLDLDVSGVEVAIAPAEPAKTEAAQSADANGQAGKTDGGKTDGGKPKAGNAKPAQSPASQKDAAKAQKLEKADQSEEQ